MTQEYEHWEPTARNFIIGQNFQQWTCHEVDGVRVDKKEPMRQKLASDVEAFLAKGGKVTKIAPQHEEIPYHGKVAVKDAYHTILAE